jgi:UDPglucose 6-dehydrogenase
VNAAIEVNEEQKYKLINKSRKYYPNFKGLVISVLGLTFKPNTDDLREAASLVSIPIFLEEGAKVKAWDPAGVKNFKKVYPTEIEYCETIDETLKNSDICFIFTEWDEVKNYSVEKFVQLMRRPIVLDGRNYVNLSGQAPELTYENIGNTYIHSENNISERGDNIIMIEI